MPAGVCVFFILLIGMTAMAIGAGNAAAIGSAVALWLTLAGVIGAVISGENERRDGTPKAKEIKCKHCHDRGYTGVNVSSGKQVVCQCKKGAE